MIETELKEVRALKEDATAFRNLGQLPRALSTIKKAIKILEALLVEPGVTANQAKDIRSELADTFGMKGGIHRREPALHEALAAYRKGRDIEVIDKQSTYNLSKVITLSITLEGRSPTDPDIHQDLQRAIEHLKAETEGPRKDEWWAWADFAQFYLLVNEPDKARACYAQARNKTGATAEEIKRHVVILEELAASTVKKAPEISRNICAVIKELA